MFISMKFESSYIMGESANEYSTLESNLVVCIMTHNLLQAFWFWSASWSLSYRNNTKDEKCFHTKTLIPTLCRQSEKKNFWCFVFIYPLLSSFFKSIFKQLIEIFHHKKIRTSHSFMEIMLISSHGKIPGEVMQE